MHAVDWYSSWISAHGLGCNQYECENKSKLITRQNQSLNKLWILRKRDCGARSDFIRGHRFFFQLIFGWQYFDRMQMKMLNKPAIPFVSFIASQDSIISLLANRSYLIFCISLSLLHPKFNASSCPAQTHRIENISSKRREMRFYAFHFFFLPNTENARTKEEEFQIRCVFKIIR